MAGKGPVLVVRRTAAIGDVIAASVVTDKLAGLGYDVIFQADIKIAQLLRRHENTLRIAHISQGRVDVNLDQCYENHPQRTKRHFSELFLNAANEQLARRGINLGPPLNCTPRLRVTEEEKQPYLARLSRYPKPWVFICPRSNAWANRTVPPYIWQEAAKLIDGTKFWLYPEAPPEGVIDLEIRSIDALPVWLACADLLVSVDTGPLHIAAAVGCPIVAMEQASSPEVHLSDQRDFVTIKSPGLDCLNCQKNVCPISEHLPPCQKFPPELIAQAVNQRLRARTSEDVSAVISIYRPEVDTLNRCLQAVEPQVAEIIICSDLAGKIPDGVWAHPKIKWVRKNLSDIGYGRKQNFGARHANGKYLLLLNDDVFLDPDAVAKMVELMKPGVGMVSNLLRYPDGTIYYAGKVRAPNVRGWAHIDYRKYLPTFTAPVELENCCGACVMVRREAFYGIRGFDEDFYLYSEDDDYALRNRQAGWSIWHAPQSTGIHMEHQSTQKTANISTLVNHANATFHKKWGWYLDVNAERIPGVFV